MKRTHATLSVYSSNSDVLDFLVGDCVADWDRSESEGTYSAHLRTIEVVHSVSLQDHLSWIISNFRLTASLCEKLEVRLWIFHESEEENEMIDLDPRTISFLEQLGATVSIDIWNLRLGVP